ncbi:DUF1877 family protein [Streptomyces sp. NPDC059917]|uniref:DUF1877 family protein n=1 Tax=Streptomyces sp. NPDC059917 TaxID=3347002 RepID=UPI0036674C71
MSILGSYVRLTVDELERARRDPAWVEALGSGGARGERWCSAGTAWDALGFLTRRIGFPVDIAHGEEALPWSGVPGAGAGAWSYGPPRCLTPGQVRTAAAAMAATDGDRLVGGVGPADLARADVYPVHAWEGGASLEGVVARYEELLPFFRAAAADGDALLVWLS